MIATFVGYYGVFDIGIVSAVQYYVAKSIGNKDFKFANQIISTSFFVFSLIAILIFAVTLVLALLSKLFIIDLAEALLFKKVILIVGTAFSVGFPCRVFLGVISANLRFDIISMIDVVFLFYFIFCPSANLTKRKSFVN